MRVTSGEFIKDYGTLAGRALSERVTITKNGLDRLVLVSAEEYERRCSHQRRAFYSEELSEEDLALVAGAEMSPEHGRTRVIVLPITHAPPQLIGDTIEIPPATKARLGLDAERSWIVLSEGNDFIWPVQSYARCPDRNRQCCVWISAPTAF